MRGLIGFILPFLHKFPLILLTRFVAELGEAPCVYGADLGCGESSLQSTKNQTGHTQIRSYLPCFHGGPDHSQKQGQDLQNAGSQDVPGHPLRRAGREHHHRDGN